jgi:hypothetical protein
MDNLKTLRGTWGANLGPKMRKEQKQARKTGFENLQPAAENTVKGWKANR